MGAYKRAMTSKFNGFCTSDMYYVISEDKKYDIFYSYIRPGLIIIYVLPLFTPLKFRSIKFPKFYDRDSIPFYYKTCRIFRRELEEITEQSMLDFTFV